MIKITRLDVSVADVFNGNLFAVANLMCRENEALYSYERVVKELFDGIAQAVHKDSIFATKVPVIVNNTRYNVMFR